MSTIVDGTEVIKVGRSYWGPEFESRCIPVNTMLEVRCFQRSHISGTPRLKSFLLKVTLIRG